MTDTTQDVIVGLGAENSDALKSIDEVGKALSETLHTAALSVLSNLESAFVEFARTGEFSVRDMVNAIIADLSRIAFDAFVERPINQLFARFGKGLGGLFTSGASGKPLPPPGTGALGGPVTFGRPYVVGEQGRELFVPETSGRIVPNHMLGGANIVFNVQTRDAESFRRSESQIAAMLHRMASRGQRNL